MEFDIHGVNIHVTEAIDDHVRSRVSHALNQYDRHIGQVRVVLKDQNGPRGGVDKGCDIEVRLLHLEPVLVKQEHADLYLAISSAADRVKVAVGRRLDKVKDKRD
ncbi:MAG: ribosome-associated translation inhibitor RaiA [Phycisphaeraceae bacterium]|nr:ribosome-associated translation inhibitor RaiA [Phycisphaeraceae bacterium]